MNEHILTDIFLFFLAAIIGGLVGGAFAFVIGRTETARPKFSFIRRKYRTAKIIEFPRK